MRERLATWLRRWWRERQEIDAGDPAAPVPPALRFGSPPSGYQGAEGEHLRWRILVWVIYGGFWVLGLLLLLIGLSLRWPLGSLAAFVADIAMCTIIIIVFGLRS